MFYWFVITIFRLFFLSFSRMKVTGRENIPKSGPFVIVPNHISHFDPPAFSAASFRGIDWLGSDILFKTTLMRMFFNGCNVIKVRQYEADQEALRVAIRRARAGRPVGLFPEGGIRAGDASVLGSASQFYEGAFMVAMMAQAPVLPCLIVGSDRLYNPRVWLRRPPIWMYFGKPIPTKGKGREEIHRLRDEALKSIREMAAHLRAEGGLCEDDWPKTPQERNPKIPPPENFRKEQFVEKAK
jgi:1-acyl-sn-glycerol-3-phosphate acyltransferase